MGLRALGRLLLPIKDNEKNAMLETSWVQRETSNRLARRSSLFNFHCLIRNEPILFSPNEAIRSHFQFRQSHYRQTGFILATCLQLVSNLSAPLPAAALSNFEAQFFPPLCCCTNTACFHILRLNREYIECWFMRCFATNPSICLRLYTKQSVHSLANRHIRACRRKSLIKFYRYRGGETGA